MLSEAQVQWSRPGFTRKSPSPHSPLSQIRNQEEASRDGQTLRALVPDTGAFREDAPRPGRRPGSPPTADTSSSSSGPGLGSTRPPTGAAASTAGIRQDTVSSLWPRLSSLSDSECLSTFLEVTFKMQNRDVLCISKFTHVQVCLGSTYFASVPRANLTIVVCGRQRWALWSSKPGWSPDLTAEGLRAPGRGRG